MHIPVTTGTHSGAPVPGINRGNRHCYDDVDRVCGTTVYL